ncbi:MAG: signal peptidase II [Clostridia bacterium]|nr:signal peptidase II [Clostridia bacterium]
MIELIIAVAVLAADMITKYLAATYWLTPVTLISGVVQLTYVENVGAAWGMLGGARLFFIVITVIFCGLIIAAYVRNRNSMLRYSKVVLALVFSGALGNLIDRIIFGYVRDMIQPLFIDFPVFNIADSAIVIGTILLIIEVLFMKNNLFHVIEEDLKTLKRKKKKDE